MKKIILLILVICVLFATSACAYNRSLVDLAYDFRYAVFNNGKVVEIKSWRDFEDGDQLQFTSVNGITYLTHASNVVLMSDRDYNLY